MIGYLRGEILEHSEGKLLVGIGGGVISGPTSDGTQAYSSSLVGYQVSVPQNQGYAGRSPGQIIELFIYTHVREDAFDLFGFQTRFEKDLFLTLLSVNGIGPKSALGILSGVDSLQLVEAILGEDQGFLTQIPGIGKKTAERMLVELKDLVRKKVEAGIFPLRPASGSAQRDFGASDTVGPGPDSSAFHQAQGAAILRDAKGALLGLGYREQEIQSVLKKAWESQNTPPQKVEDLVRSALRYL